MKSEKRINNLERIASDKETVVAWQQLDDKSRYKVRDTGKILTEKEIKREYPDKNVLFVKYTNGWGR